MRYTLTYFDKVGSRAFTDNFGNLEEAVGMFGRLVSAYEDDGTDNTGLELWDTEEDKLLAEWNVDEGTCLWDKGVEEILVSKGLTDFDYMLIED